MKPCSSLELAISELPEVYQRLALQAIADARNNNESKEDDWICVASAKLALAIDSEILGIIKGEAK